MSASEPPVQSRCLKQPSGTAEHFAEQELANRDASLPGNCCTIIAWSCAQLRVFRPSLFAKLAAIATPQLRSCQPHEVTNLLWALAELCKYDQDAASDAAPELRALSDAVVSEVFSRQAMVTSRCKSSPQPSCLSVLCLGIRASPRLGSSTAPSRSSARAGRSWKSKARRKSPWPSSE